MANDFEYLEDNQHYWPTGAHETPEEEDMHTLLDEWGIYKNPAIGLKQLEEWYGRIHVPVYVEPQCTGAQLRFERLRKEWIRGTEKISILSQIVLHPAYQQIIAIGPDAIPLILRSLESKLDHWFWALKMLNNGDDVAEGATTLRAAADMWLSWGREKGYLG